MTTRDDTRHETLRTVLTRLARSGVLPLAPPAADFRRQGVNGRLRKAVRAEVQAYSGSGNPDVLPGLDAHIAEHLEEIARLCQGGDPGDFASVTAYARKCAEQRFPLEAALHCYQCLHGTVADWLCHAVAAACPDDGETAAAGAAGFALAYFNTVSTILASEYVSHTRMLAEAESDRRTELLAILLSGYDESDGHVSRLLKRSGYLDRRQTYCVAVAQPTNPSEMENPDRAQRIANALSEAVSKTPIRILSGIRNNVVTAVLSDARRQSGWTAPQTNLAERLRTLFLGLGPAVLVGTSTDHPSTAFLPRALNEAMIALEFTTVTKRVVQFADLPLRSLMLHSAGDYVRSAAPGWIGPLVEADARNKGTLLATLRGLADADLNVQKAGRQLGVHPNTIYARLERIRDLTGLDGQRHHDLVELLLAADCWQPG